MNPGTVSFDKRLPNFADKSASNDEFWNPTSIIPILTLEPVNVEFELLCGLSLLYEKVESFHAIELADLVTVGLVFTAKSIARYNKISESQSFAEYYLIGSLFSMISVLIVFGLLYL